MWFISYELLTFARAELGSELLVRGRPELVVVVRVRVRAERGPCVRVLAYQGLHVLPVRKERLTLKLGQRQCSVVIWGEKDVQLWGKR